jgi:translation initiation factor 1 (eIF-1/SUI1)
MAQNSFKIKTTASVKKKKVQVAANISITEDQHTKLIGYLKKRLDFASIMRGKRLDRYKLIDKEVAGFMVLDEDDKKRQLDNAKGFGPKVYDVNIPLAATQMDEAVTFFTTVFFPEEGPYNAVTHPDEEQVAKGFSTLMNKHASYYKHFTHFAKGSYAGLKYNQGLWLIEWQRTFGSVVQNAKAGTGAAVEDNQLVMQGNKMEALDVYNTLLDPSVHPTELHEKGEFFATVEPETIFKAEMMAQNRQIFGLERIIDKEGNLKTNPNKATYYEEKPEIHGDSIGGNGSGETDWFEFMSGGGKNPVGAGLEKVHIYIWINPKKHGLSNNDVYQIWRFTLLDMQVVAAEQLTNAHGFLPLVGTVPWDDEFGLEAKSYGEMLLPYQRFSSFQINIHQRASRKALYNLILYNSRMLPKMADADSLGGKVPFNPTMDDNDINKAVKTLSDTPDTSNTLRDVEAMDTLMQKILPTDMLKQVAGLERATQYQAAATVQGANRRNLKIAKIIDTQAFSVARKIQMFNILQYQESVDILDEAGNKIEIDPSQFRDQQMEFTISDGLRGLDKLILIETMKEVLTLLVQNPQAASAFNIADIIDYTTTLIGDHTSFAQFKFENEFDKLPPEQKQQAFELLQRALQAQGQAQGQAAGQANAEQLGGVQ